MNTEELTHYSLCQKRILIPLANNVIQSDLFCIIIIIKEVAIKSVRGVMFNQREREREREREKEKERKREEKVRI